MEAQEVGTLLNRTTAHGLRLFLRVEECANGGDGVCVGCEKLCVEVWCVGVLIHSGAAWEVGTKITHRHLYTALLNMLHSTSEGWLMGRGR